LPGLNQFCIVLGLYAFLSTTLAGQDQNSHVGHQPSGPVPREILVRPVELRTGIGTVHEKVSTSSPEAQAFYDQGLAYIHSYVWIEAIRSFHQALRSDPNMSMAFVGLADAYLGLQDVETARAALEQGKRTSKNLSTREQQWFEIREREIESVEDSSDPDRYVAYRKAINETLKIFPDDPWFWVQRGLADEPSPFTHGQVGGVDASAFYRMALSLSPDNLAALHYYAHAMENIGRPKEAIEQSTKYAKQAPAIPHAQHMYGHELLRVGRTEEAIQQFLKAKELEENYYHRENILAKYDWHHAHNLQLLAMSYQSLGQIRSAEAAFKAAFHSPAYTEFLEYNRKVWPEFLLDRGRFSEALEASQELVKSGWPMARLAGHALSGQALLGLDRLGDAKEELTLAEQETEQIPPRAIAALPYPGALRANILLRENNIEEGEALTKEIEASILAMPGPDAWCSARFELESIAQSARLAGDWSLAEFTAQQMLRHDPTYAGGYFALALVADHAGDKVKARQNFAKAQKYWNKADQDLPELKLLH
jgi:tetratricopeptide (TPR) repeat protein